MSKAIITEGLLTDIADAIRAKNGAVATYTPSEMAAAIASIPAGSSITLPADCSRGKAWNAIVPELDVSDVTDMKEWFYHSDHADFNPDFSDWDTSKVTDMESMFAYCSGAAFNPDLHTWDVSKVTTFTNIFNNCSGEAFNPNMRGWVFSQSLTTLSSMFAYCFGAAFNPDIGGWDVSKVQSFASMFTYCHGAAFNPDLSEWDMTACNNISSMFSNCKGDAFNPKLDMFTTIPNTRSVQTTGIFTECSGALFNPDLSKLANVIKNSASVANIFRNCSGAAFNPDLSGWDTTGGKMKNCQYMFSNIAKDSHKKMWLPKEFVFSGTSSTYRPLAADPGSLKCDVYTDATSAADAGWGTPHSNYTMHYNSSHAAFVNA